MSAHFRIRTQTRTITEGLATFDDPDLIPTQLSTTSRRDNSQDVVGNPHNSNAFDVNHTVLNGAWLVNGYNREGTPHPGGSGWLYQNYGVGSFGTQIVSTPFPKLSVSAAFVKGLALTNPNRPFTDVPVFLAELRDIPGLIREWGHDILAVKNYFHVANKPFKSTSDVRFMPRIVGRKYIEWQFGVRPFLQDVQRMVDIAFNVDKKLKQISHLAKGNMRRHATVYSDTVISSTVYPAYVSDLYGERSEFSFRLKTDRKQWVSTRWSPLFPDSLPKSDDDRLALARRLSTGAGISMATLWEAMPWSWFIDWFSNVGDIVQADRNTIPVTHTDSCVMDSTKTSIVSPSWIDQRGNLTLSFQDVIYSEASRVLAPLVVYPEFSLPLLSDSQLSILSGLHVMKRDMKL